MSKLILHTLSVVILTIAFSVSYGQTGSVSGMVKDKSSGETMPGANVLIKGTLIGQSADFDGKFLIADIPVGTVEIEASFVGYLPVTKTIVITEGKTLMVNFDLTPDAVALEETVVIGYGVQKKSDKTGAISHVTADELNQGSLTDPIQGLQGKAAGVLITKKGGDPNAGFSVRIRGSAGYESNTQPLFVIDGVPNADPTAIASEDIESYNVLKDAASTAIYGSQGANGVIIITTKKGSMSQVKGKKSPAKVELSSRMSFDKVANTLNVLSADELRKFAELKLQASLPGHPDWTVDSIFTDGGTSTDWQKEIYRLGVTNETHLNFYGGDENSSYYGSIGRSTWQGVMKGTEKDRTNAKVNLSHKALNDKLTLSGNLTTSFENNDYENYGGWGKDDIIYQAISRNPTDPVFDADGNYDKTQREFNYENPLAIINMVTNVRDAKRYNANIKADLEITKGLIGSVSAGYLRSDQEGTYFRPAGVFASADNGFARRYYENNVQKIIETTLNYNKKINDFHNIDVIAGHSWQENGYDGFSAQATNAQSPGIGADNLQSLVDVKWGDVNSYRGESRLIGMFGRVQYNFNSTYYASASIRRDGSTKFGENNRWGWFPTAALGWSIHNEEFMSQVKWVDQLKLRAGYGVSGNQAIGSYRSQVAWQPSGIVINPETGQQVISFQPAWNANPDLRWERTGEINVGIDFAMFNSRISGSLEVYSKNTTDLLGIYFVPVPPNLSNTTYANSGAITNKGIELYAQAFLVDKRDVKWKSSLTVAHNKSKFTDLGDYQKDEDGVRKAGYISGRGMVGDEYFVSGFAVGQEVGAFYLPKYVGIQNGYFIYESKSGGFTNKLADAKRKFVGSANPDVELGWSNSVTLFKNWNVDFAFRSLIGNQVYNATKMFFDFPGNMPSLNGLPEAEDWYNQGRTMTGATIADIYLEDASFVRLDYITLAYNVNTSKIDWLNSLKVYVVANNLFTITGYSGIDPETSIGGVVYGIDQYNVYPKTRTFSIGFNASF
ncbi:MAG: SusC/RagA family TonB-linked outer membrane protein [Bacteroidales bacterium]|nr:SusC/RagA family TonB-linked outer membrane protein [Bacteroidales bacterium]